MAKPTSKRKSKIQKNVGEKELNKPKILNKTADKAKAYITKISTYNKTLIQ